MLFSLRSCRSSSVISFYFSQGNLENLVGNLEGIFRGFFLTHRTKAQKFRGKFRSIFRKKIRGSKKIFRAKFTLQTCHLNMLGGAAPHQISPRWDARKPRSRGGHIICLHVLFLGSLFFLQRSKKMTKLPRSCLAPNPRRNGRTGKNKGNLGIF